MVFLVHWIKWRLGFFLKKPFLGFFLSFFINYVAMSIFCLDDKLFNEDKNYHQYTIGTALIIRKTRRNKQRPSGQCYAAFHPTREVEVEGRMGSRPVRRVIDRWELMLPVIKLLACHETKPTTNLASLPSLLVLCRFLVLKGAPIPPVVLLVVTTTL